VTPDDNGDVATAPLEIASDMIGFDRFPLSIAAKVRDETSIAALCILARGKGPFAALAGQMMSDILDGGVFDSEGRLIRMAARLDARSYWIDGYVAVDGEFHFPQSIETSMNGRDAGSFFGVDALTGRRIISHGTSDADVFYALLEPDVVTVKHPGPFRLAREMAIMTPRLMKNIATNLKERPGRTARLLLTTMMMAAVIAIILPIAMIPGWLDALIMMAAGAFLVHSLDARDWKAQERAEKRGRMLSHLA